MNKEEITKALELFDREDLINDIEDLDTGIEVFMTVNQMIYYSKLQQENKQLKELVYKDNTGALIITLNKELELQERIDKVIQIVSCDTTLNPDRQRKRMIEILKGDSNE